MRSVVNTIITMRGVKKITRLWAYPLLKRRIERDLKELSLSKHFSVDNGKRLKIAYVRHDFWLSGNSANGAAAHTKGVVDAFVELGHDVKVYSPYKMSCVMDDISQIVCTPAGLLTGISELEEMDYNDQFYKFLYDHLQKEKPDLIYQRYGRNNYAALLLAKRLGIPFILEYNGSEIWMSKNWGHSLRYQEMTERIENSVLSHVDIVVGNAEAFVKELCEKGVQENRILIVPNGVNYKRFVDISDNEVRSKYSIPNDSPLITFVGSFGPWHGAEVLAAAIKEVVRELPSARFLFVGNGERVSAVKGIVDSEDVSDKVCFAGTVQPSVVPNILSASDILVSPQVRNPDGTPFFGSPTKLFEYMAAGKAIVASRLDQLEVILSDGETALLVEPGDAKDLSRAIIRLCKEEELRLKLGLNAQKTARTKYSWNSHVQQILHSFHAINS